MKQLAHHLYKMNFFPIACPSPAHFLPIGCPSQYIFAPRCSTVAHRVGQTAHCSTFHLPIDCPSAAHRLPIDCPSAAHRDSKFQQENPDYGTRMPGRRLAGGSLLHVHWIATSSVAPSIAPDCCSVPVQCVALPLPSSQHLE